MTTAGNKLIFRNKGEDSITGLPDPQVHIISIPAAYEKYFI